MKKILLIMLIFVSVMIFYNDIANANAARNCQNISPELISSIDLNGRDMWLHLADSYVARGLDKSSTCIIIAGKKFNSVFEKEGAENFFKMQTPKETDLKHVIVNLM